MSSQRLVRQFLRAVLHELYRSKAVYNVLASLVLLLLIVMAYMWRESYVSNATISTAGDGKELVAVADYADVRAKRLTDLIASEAFLKSLSFKDKLPEESTKELSHAESLSEYLSAKQIKNDAVRVSYRSSNPEIAQLLLNLVVEKAMAELLPLEDIAHLEAVLAQIAIQEESKKASLVEIEEQLAAKGDNSGQNSVRIQDRVASLRESMQDVNVELSAATAKIGRIQRELNKEEKIQSEKRLLAQLRSQKPELVEAINDAIEVYGEFAPEVISLQQELDAVNAQIYELTENTVLYSEEQESESLYENLRKQLTLETLEKEELESRKRSLNTLLKEAQNRASASQSRVKQNQRQQKEYKLILADYEDIQKRKEQNQAKLKSLEQSASFYQITEKPSIPEQHSGVGFIEIVILGPLVALFLPFVVASMIILFDSRIRTSRQLKKGMPEGLVIMATIPHYDSPQASRVFRRALIGIVIWALLVFSVYFVLGYIGLKNW